MDGKWNPGQGITYGAAGILLGSSERILTAFQAITHLLCTYVFAPVLTQSSHDC
jgi:hypothetical protein